MNNVILHQLIALAVLASIGYLLYCGLWNIMKETREAKITAMREATVQSSNACKMYQDAKWMCRVIGDAKTYKDICIVEEELDKFANDYRGCEGFAGVVKELSDLLEDARGLVRVKDKPRQFNPRYTCE